MNAAIIAKMGLDSGDMRKGLVDIERTNKGTYDRMAKDAERAARRAAEATKRAAAEQSAALRNVAGELAGVVGIPLGLGAIAAAGQAILDFAGNLQDASDAIGINVESLQELQGAFSQSGVDAEKLNKGLSKLGENMVAAKGGDTKLIATFRALGVSWEDLNRLAPDEVLMKIAGSAGEAADPTERLAQIVDVLGKSGLKMAAGLNGGVEALQKMRGETAKLTKEEVASLDEAGDALTRLYTRAKVAGAKEVVNAQRKGLVKTAVSLLFPTAGVVMDAQEQAKARDSEKGYKPNLEPAALASREQTAAKFVPLAPEKRAEMEDQVKAAMELLRLETQNANKLDDQLADQDAARAEDQKKYGEDLLDEQKKQYAEYKDYVEQANIEIAAKQKQREEQLHQIRKQAIDDEAKRRDEKLGEKKDNIRDPRGRTARRREQRREDSLNRRAQRETELDERGGKSAADANKDDRPLSERMKPKGIGRQSTDPRENRAADVREGIASGEPGGGKKSDDFTGQMDKTEMARDISEIRKNLRGAKR